MHYHSVWFCVLYLPRLPRVKDDDFVSMQLGFQKIKIRCLFLGFRSSKTLRKHLKNNVTNTESKFRV